MTPPGEDAGDLNAFRWSAKRVVARDGTGNEPA
jgi:hypothetical protein